MVKIITVLLLLLGFSSFGIAEDKPLTGADVVRQCLIKDPGEDQRSLLTVVLKDSAGNEKKSTYRRYWKAYKQNDGLAEKMMLFTDFPPDAKGAAFMRWGYEQKGEDARQWIYLPALRKIRQVTVRDLGDSFLGSDLTYGDITPRNVDDDEHKLIGKQQVGDGQFFVVESTPKKYLYSKVIHWFRLGADRDDCVVARTDYYDHKGQLLKKQLYNWQRVKNAWVWSKVIVENVQTYHASLFQVENVSINIGLQDADFNERTMRGTFVSNLWDEKEFALKP